MIREQQFSGCLIGQCLGDALGFVVEGHPPEVCLEYVSGTLNAGQAGERGPRSYPSGQYSDDSQLARELLQSYLSCGGRFDPRDYAGRVAAIFVEGRIVGRGRATERAALLLASGRPWEESGTPSPSAGNGSAMRAGPIGLLFFDDPEAMVRAAHDQGRITHRDPRCSAGSVAVAGAVALALAEEEIEVGRFLSQLADWAARFDRSVAEGLRELTAWVPLPPEEAAKAIFLGGRVERGQPAGLAARHLAVRNDERAVEPVLVPEVPRGLLGDGLHGHRRGRRRRHDRGHGGGDERRPPGARRGPFAPGPPAHGPGDLGF